MDKKKIKLAKANGVAQDLYPALVNELIRERYTVDMELAIQRQRESKPQEFSAYDEYCEECKVRARRELGL